MHGVWYLKELSVEATFMVNDSFEFLKPLLREMRDEGDA